MTTTSRKSKQTAYHKPSFTWNARKDEQKLILDAWTCEGDVNKNLRLIVKQTVSWRSAWFLLTRSPILTTFPYSFHKFVGLGNGRSPAIGKTAYNPFPIQAIFAAQVN